jgi:hypothetical protein
MNEAACRLNELARLLGARRYLEVGVSFGHTFRDIGVAERTGVDPDFAFDTSAVIDASTRLVARISDDFFAAEPFLPYYDIVYIDGLHVFEQVVRDLSNTLLRTNHRSVVMLDDTMPSDVFSALPDHEAALRLRAESGNGDRSWHGDVFKTVFYIHDFLPGLNYRTMIDSGHGQTLVWRACNLRRRPLFGNLEKISRLTWFDMKEHLPAMQICTEQEAFRLCLSELPAA